MKKRTFVQTSKLSNNICFYDLETGGNDPFTTEPLELYAIIVDQQTLTPKENGTFGPVIIKPNNWDLVHDDALEKNKLTREELAEGMDQELVFKQFCDFCRMFQKKDSKWEACISGGYNIKGFDNIIMTLLCKKYGYLDADGSQKLFHPIHTYDLIDYIRIYFENYSDGPNGYGLIAVRDYFGISSEGAHRAEKDVEDTLAITKRLVTFHRKISQQHLHKFRGAFKNVPNKVD